MILMGPLEGGDHGSDGVSHLVACVARNDPVELKKSTAQFSIGRALAEKSTMQFSICKSYNKCSML